VHELKLLIHYPQSVIAATSVGIQHTHIKYFVYNLDREIYYYFAEGEVFIHCGINPVSEEVRIDLKEIDLKTHLHLKVKDLGLSHIERLMLTQNLVSHVEKEKDEPSDE